MLLRHKVDLNTTDEITLFSIIMNDLNETNNKLD